MGWGCSCAGLARLPDSQSWDVHLRSSPLCLPLCTGPGAAGGQTARDPEAPRKEAPAHWQHRDWHSPALSCGPDVHLVLTRHPSEQELGLRRPLSLFQGSSVARLPVSAGQRKVAPGSLSPATAHLRTCLRSLHTVTWSLTQHGSVCWSRCQLRGQESYRPTFPTVIYVNAANF